MITMNRCSLLHLVCKNPQIVTLRLFWKIVRWRKQSSLSQLCSLLPAQFFGLSATGSLPVEQQTPLLVDSVVSARGLISSTKRGDSDCGTQYVSPFTSRTSCSDSLNLSRISMEQPEMDSPASKSGLKHRVPHYNQLTSHRTKIFS
jgi:hypothetical protein